MKYNYCSIVTILFLICHLKLWQGAHAKFIILEVPDSESEVVEDDMRITIQVQKQQEDRRPSRSESSQSNRQSQRQKLLPQPEESGSQNVPVQPKDLPPTYYFASDDSNDYVKYEQRKRGIYGDYYKHSQPNQLELLDKIRHYQRLRLQQQERRLRRRPEPEVNLGGHQPPNEYYCTLCDRIPEAHGATFRKHFEPLDEQEYERSSSSSSLGLEEPQSRPPISAPEFDEYEISQERSPLRPFPGMPSIVKNFRQIPTVFSSMENKYRQSLRNAILGRPKLPPNLDVVDSYPEDGRFAESFENSGA